MMPDILRVLLKYINIIYIIIVKRRKNKMAVKIRLKRMGAKKSPFYRVVVADSRYPRDGRFIEEIGTYNPMVEPAAVNIDVEKAQKWLKNGAQPTDTVKVLLKKTGITE